MDYVEWRSLSTGVYVAKSTSVMSVEECPLCGAALSTEPDDFGEIQCLGRHVFVVDDDGSDYTACHVDSVPRRVPTAWVWHEGAHVANLDSDVIGCPGCSGPLDFSAIAAKDSSGAFRTGCTSGHEFNARIVVPHIWLYDADDDSLSVWEKWNAGKDKEVHDDPGGSLW